MLSAHPPQRRATLTTPSPGTVTRLLLDWTKGDRAALDKLVPLVYAELRRLAGRQLQRERPDHTLQPTALVHEAYLRLVDERGLHVHGRAHFLAIAARVMREILVDHARRRGRAKRGGGEPKLALDSAAVPTDPQPVDVIALDEALTRLSVVDPQQSRIVELRFFGGLTIEETAGVLEVSPATIKREWGMAKAWLYRELHMGGAA